MSEVPRQLLGLTNAPGAHEYLLGALVACMSVVFVLGASILGVHLERLSIEIDGELDLRDLLGLDNAVPVQLQDVRYRIRVRGDSTPEQYAALHERMKRHSPNYNAFINPVSLQPAAVEIIDDQG